MKIGVLYGLIVSAWLQTSTAAHGMMIVNWYTGKCLEASSSGEKALQRDCDGNINQRWLTSWTGSNTVIRSAGKTLYLADAGMMTESKFNWTLGGSKEYFGGFVRTFSKSGRYLEISGGNGEDHADVHTYKWTGSGWQQWVIFVESRLAIQRAVNFWKGRHRDVDFRLSDLERSVKQELKYTVRANTLTKGAYASNQVAKKYDDKLNWSFIDAVQFYENYNECQLIPVETGHKIVRCFSDSCYTDPEFYSCDYMSSKHWFWRNRTYQLQEDRTLKLIGRSASESNIRIERYDPSRTLRGVADTISLTNINLKRIHGIVSDDKAGPGVMKKDMITELSTDSSVPTGFKGGVAEIIQTDDTDLLPRETNYSIDFEYQISGETDREFEFKVVEYDLYDDSVLGSVSEEYYVSAGYPGWKKYSARNTYVKKQTASVVVFYLTWKKQHDEDNAPTQLHKLKIATDY